MAHEEKCNYIPIRTCGEKLVNTLEDFVQNLKKIVEHYIHWEFGG